MNETDTLKLLKYKLKVVNKNENIYSTYKTHIWSNLPQQQECEGFGGYVN